MIAYLKYHRRVVVAILVGLLSAICVLLTPFMVKKYIEYKYPLVKVGSANYIWGGIKFKDVIVNSESPLVNAKLTSVSVWPISKRVYVAGGTVVAVINAMASGKKSSGDKLNGWAIRAEHIDADVTKQDLHVKLNDVSYNNSNKLITFESALVDYKSFSVKLIKAKVPQDLSKLEIAEAQLIITLPFIIPKLGKLTNTLTATGITVFVKDQRALVRSFNYSIFSGQDIEIVGNESDVAISAKTLSIDHKWLGNELAILHNLIVAISKRTKTGIAFVGPARLKLEFDIENQTVIGKGACTDWVRALPDPIPESLQRIARSYTGDLAVTIKLKPVPDFKLHNSCTFRCSQSPIKDLFDPNGFTYTAYHPNGKPFERKVGLNEPSWTPMGSMAPAIVLAVTTLEDPSFQSHSGILPIAIKNSLLANLKTGKFSRGGSTITMQLAKNLWLNRDKTLLRKANEAMLTFALESCLNKEQIMELYLNVVEFGPDVYGIGPASKYYFNKLPSGLTNEEAFFLASALPRPNRMPNPQSGGLLQTRGLMRMLARNGGLIQGLVTESE